jgi:hypothetical protein
MLTALQCAVLGVAIQAGAPDLSDSLPAVALVESSLGVQLVGDDGQSYGAFQMTLPTAHEVLLAHPNLRKGRRTEAQVKAGLMTDVRWAAALAAARLRDLIRDYGWERGHRAYAAGVTGMLNERAPWRPGDVREAMKDTKRYARECGLADAMIAERGKP